MISNFDRVAPSPQDGASPHLPPLRIAAEGFLMVRPLIHGLDSRTDVELLCRPPQQMRHVLATGQAHAALLPALDLKRYGAPLTLIPAGCLSATGRNLATRIFANVPPSEIRTLWCDNTSTTTVALARVIWQAKYNRDLRIVPFNAAAGDPPDDADAVLLIGDRVVVDPPIGFERQFDVVSLWHELTGLPFVGAVWAAPLGGDHERLFSILADARRDGCRHLDQIAQRVAPTYGWPVDLAFKPLLQSLQYEFTDAHLEGLEEFFSYASEMGLVEPDLPLHCYQPRIEA